MTGQVHRVSARTKQIEYDKKYKTKYCIPEWLRDEQIRLACKRVSGRFVPLEWKRSEAVAVVGYGPSLSRTWEKLRGFDYVISCSGAHKYLIDRGIVPSWHVEVDPREHKIDLLGKAHKDVVYLPSSTSHPKYLDHLLESGAEVKLWHVFTNESAGLRTIPNGEWSLTGGADAGLRALVIARLLGFVDIHVFGLDGSSGFGDMSHADKHPNSPGKFFDMEFPKGSGVIYRTTPALLSCAKSVPHEVDQIKDAKVTFYGDGLIQAIMRNHKPKKPKEALLALQKPEVISESYKKLNEQLHNENAGYGVGGQKYAETVLNLCKKLETNSVLDYGCGKGLLGKSIPFPIWEYDPAIPGKDESPRPADIVVCTDVLEHIEPECLDAVLADLKRCVLKVGLFVIHTGPAAKVLADGRNAHLIQKPADWWTKALSKLFTIGSVNESHPLVQYVVGPLEKKEPKDITKVEKDGTKVTFFTPNETTKWRANSLFTKEPCTIDWIESFGDKDVLWDVGANVGGYTVWAAKRKGVKVVAFEPEAQNYSVLSKNIKLNKLDAKAYCLAASDKSGISELYVSHNDAGGSCNSFSEKVGPDLKERDGYEQGCVGVRLDEIPLDPPTHIKIDVDGLEHKVIEGAKKILECGKVKSLLIEVNSNLIEHKRMVSYLKDIGYSFDMEQVKKSIRNEGPFKGCAEVIFRKKERKRDWFTVDI